MKHFHRLAIAFALVFCCLTAGCRTTQSAQDIITVSGEIWTRGQAPFTALVLTTDQNNHYVLINKTAIQLKNPSTARITGRLYAADWNGQRFAHIDVIDVEPMTNDQ